MVDESPDDVCVCGHPRRQHLRIRGETVDGMCCFRTFERDHKARRRWLIECFCLQFKMAPVDKALNVRVG